MRQLFVLPRLVCILLLTCHSWAQETIVLPIEPTTSGIFITATVNGEPAHLLLDTGAARTIVDHRYAKKAIEIDRVSVVSVNERNSMQSAPIKEVAVSLGTLKLARWRTIVVDTAPASSRAGARIDGFLGLDVLGRFRSFQIDVKEKTLTLMPCRETPQRSLVTETSRGFSNAVIQRFQRLVTGCGD